MQIINNHPCYLHVPKNPDSSHKMTKVLRAVQLFCGHSKKDIQKLAAFVICKSIRMGGVYYPGYAFTELCRNRYLAKIPCTDLRTHRMTYIYDITEKGSRFLDKANENDLKQIEKLRKG